MGQLPVWELSRQALAVLSCSAGPWKNRWFSGRLCLGQNHQVEVSPPPPACSVTQGHVSILLAPSSPFHACDGRDRSCLLQPSGLRASPGCFLLRTRQRRLSLSCVGSPPGPWSRGLLPCVPTTATLALACCPLYKSMKDPQDSCLSPWQE